MAPAAAPKRTPQPDQPQRRMAIGTQPRPTLPSDDLAAPAPTQHTARKTPARRSRYAQSRSTAQPHAQQRRLRTPEPGSALATQFALAFDVYAGHINRLNLLEGQPKAWARQAGLALAAGQRLLGTAQDLQMAQLHGHPLTEPARQDLADTLRQVPEQLQMLQPHRR